MRSWLPALRIARREARRSRGRSALVLAMIMLPVLALTYMAVSFDMFALTGDESFTQEHGASDAAVTWRYTGPLRQEWSGLNAESEAPFRAEGTTERQILAVLPPGSRITPTEEGGIVSLRTRAGAGQLTAVGIDVGDPLAAGHVGLVEGAAPAGPGEIAVTRPAAARLGVRVGDAVQRVGGEGARSWRVTGVVEFPGDLSEIVVFPPGAVPTGDAGIPPQYTWLADTPAPIAWSDVLRYNERGLVVASRAVFRDPPDPSATPYGGDDVPTDRDDARTLGIGGLIAGLGLLEVVLLAGPAFAVGARRRQRDLALVAANGGTPAHLRRIVLADGVVLGLGGGVLGIALGIAVAFAGRPLAEEYLVHSRAGGYRVFPLALLAIAGLAVLTGVVAALVPAFAAARLNLVAALTGRRGVVRSRKRWLVLGLAMFGGGAALVGYGAVRVDERPILAGLIVAELGLVLCTPTLVGLIARAGAVLPLAPRIALRDTARNRSSAAPAISAVMAAVAGSVAIGVYLVSSEAQQEARYVPGMPTGYVALAHFGTGQSFGQVAARVEQAARATLPVRETYRLSSYGCPAGTAAELSCSMWPEVPPGNECFLDDVPQPHTKEQQRAALRDWRCDAVSGRVVPNNSSPLNDDVDDGTLLGRLYDVSGADLAQARRVLAAGGMVTSDPRHVKDGRATIAVYDRVKQSNESSPKAVHVTVPAYVVTSGVRVTEHYSPALVSRLGFAVEPGGLVAATTRMPSQDEEDALRAALEQIDPELAHSIRVERGANPRENPMTYLLAAAAALITLGAAGIATGLAAADGRADLSTLAAVGASPRLRRALSLSQSGVIAGLGSLLGVVAGLGAAFAVLHAFNQAIADRWPITPSFPLTVPWQNLLVVLAVPLVAMLGAGLLTRSRLPIERRMT